MAPQLRAAWHRRKFGQRLFACYFPLILERAERAGQRDTRRRLLAQAAGRTLELGAGSGANVAAGYPDSVTELVITEPSGPMLRRLHERLALEPDVAARCTVARVDAERLPFAGASFDTVVATYMLCSVPDPAVALAEITRVLAPGGRYLFIEHVHAGPGSILGAIQDLVELPHRLIAAGCRPNRHTAELIRASPLRVERLERGRQPSAPPTVRPIILGCARRN